MADNYLEKRQQEVFGGGAPKKVVRVNKSLNDLLLKNRSHRSYDSSVLVTLEQLRDIISVCDKLPSARNQQALRFRLVCADESDLISSGLRLGGALADLKLPTPGTAPTAYIVICAESANLDDRFLNMDIGIAAQSMLLKAVELGLNGIMIGAFDRGKLREDFDLKSEPVLLLGIGKGADHIQIIHVDPAAPKTYYRKDGLHYVPKIHPKDLEL